jgi:DinB superfamily
MKPSHPDQLRYPIGKFQKPVSITPLIIKKYQQDLETFPNRLKDVVAHLNEGQLDTSYRPGGWTIRQLVHHCADSHLNAYIRFKLALTEDNPTIKPYDQDRWAELPDSTSPPIMISLQLLESLHYRWIVLLNSLQEKELRRTFYHPEHSKEFQLDEVLGQYAWHGNHHLAQINQLKKQKGWK